MPPVGADEEECTSSIPSALGRECGHRFLPLPPSSTPHSPQASRRAGRRFLCRKGPVGSSSRLRRATAPPIHLFGMPKANGCGAGAECDAAGMPVTLRTGASALAPRRTARRRSALRACAPPAVQRRDASPARTRRTLSNPRSCDASRRPPPRRSPAAVRARRRRRHGRARRVEAERENDRESQRPPRTDVRRTAGKTTVQLGGQCALCQAGTGRPVTAQCSAVRCSARCARRARAGALRGAVWGGQVLSRAQSEQPKSAGWADAPGTGQSSTQQIAGCTVRSASWDDRARTQAPFGIPHIPLTVRLGEGVERVVRVRVRATGLGARCDTERPTHPPDPSVCLCAGTAGRAGCGCDALAVDSRRRRGRERAGESGSAIKNRDGQAKSDRDRRRRPAGGEEESAE